ncbi:hypothetical protein ACH4JS_13325 [Streptomyces sp. NPDC017638]|uniref:hypothetical protein n=1 Tax=Streptomyces sp. NPDC017638 TaxID=3365004 RepID=UPI00379E041D
MRPPQTRRRHRAGRTHPDQHHRDPGPAHRRPHLPAGSYRPGNAEKVCVVLCGANTDPTDLTSTNTAH